MYKSACIIILSLFFMKEAQEINFSNLNKDILMIILRLLEAKPESVDDVGALENRMRDIVRLSTVSEGTYKAIGGTFFGVFFKATSSLRASLKEFFIFRDEKLYPNECYYDGGKQIVSRSISSINGISSNAKKYNENLLAQECEDLNKYLISASSAESKFGNDFIAIAVHATSQQFFSL